MASNLQIIFQGLNLTKALIRLTNRDRDILQDKEMSLPIRMLAVAGRVFDAGFAAYEAEMMVHESSAADLMYIKEWEIGEKLFSFATRCAVATSRVCRSQSFYKELGEVAEQEVLASLVDLIRTCIEKDAYREKDLLETHAEPFDLDNCLSRLASLEATSGALSILGVDFDVKMVNRLMNAVISIEDDELHLNEDMPILEEPVPMPIQPNIFHQTKDYQNAHPKFRELLEAQRNQNSLDLLTLGSIPEHLYENDPNSVFRKATCVISLSPARYPVKDPTGGDHLYDHIHILKHLQNHKTSPFTTLPLKEEDLLPMPHMQKLINLKLQSIQNRREQVLDEISLEPGINS